jgi:hypothetical protein
LETESPHLKWPSLMMKNLLEKLLKIKLPKTHLELSTLLRDLSEETSMTKKFKEILNIYHTKLFPRAESHTLKLRLPTVKKLCHQRRSPL